MLNALNARMMASDDKQISLTDPDARSMATSGKGSGMVGYNVQSARRGTPSGSARARIEPDAVVLMFQVRRRGDAEWKTIEQHVLIIKTACHFGQSRPWFRCSACLGRVAVIYRGGEQFACRSCSGLSYASQQEPLSQRGLQRAQKIRPIA
jgi:hypothetical protein